MENVQEGISILSNQSVALVSIVIPAFNAERHLEAVIQRIPASLWEVVQSIVIVNDGSTDSTESVILKLQAEYNKIELVSLKINRGYGVAVRTGLERCRELNSCYTVCLHSDGQYPPENILSFLTIMESNGIDLLQGSRIASKTALKGGMPLYKYVAGRILTFFENCVFGLKMTDYHSGFLLYSKRAMGIIPFNKLSGSFDFDLEVIAVARARFLKISEEPIPTCYADEVSYLNPVTYGLRVLRVMAKYALGYYRRLK